MHPSGGYGIVFEVFEVVTAPIGIALHSIAKPLFLAEHGGRVPTTSFVVPDVICSLSGLQW